MKVKINKIPNIKLMGLVQDIANEYYGGHFTIMSFTTEVKFSFNTVTDRDDIFDLIAYDDINSAIENAIQEHFLTIKH